MRNDIPRTIPFAGYHYQPSRTENAELTHVGRDTPGGEYLRRFWHPIAMAEEINQDTPLRIRVLGEDLVLFRDKSGHVGLLHLRCSHRGASLEYGIIAEQGIKCCYHGWHYDVDGRILATPGDPASAVKGRICHGAYPTHEWGGLIFVYMGPPDARPAFPIYDSFVWPEGSKIYAYKLDWPCNWLQVHENGADPMHTVFVHAAPGQVQFTDLFSAFPTNEFVETPGGLLAVSTRRWKKMMYVRASDMMLPNVAQFGTGFVTGEEEKLAFCQQLTRWVTPIDDDHCWVIGVRYVNDVIDPEGKSRPDLIGMGRIDNLGQTGDRPYVDRQRNPGDWDAQVSQGPIAVHPNEILMPSDRGVIMLRRQLRRGISQVASGETLTTPRHYQDGEIVPTYGIELVIEMPSQPNVSEEELARRFGRSVAEISISSAAAPPNERRRLVKERIRDLITHGVLAERPLEDVEQ